MRGFDGGKKVNGRKRHILVDTLGLVLTATAHSAYIHDRAGVPLLLDGANRRFPRLAHVWVDQGYTGSGKRWIEEQLGWSVEVVQHPRTWERGSLGVQLRRDRPAHRPASVPHRTEDQPASFITNESHCTEQY